MSVTSTSLLSLILFSHSLSLSLSLSVAIALPLSLIAHLKPCSSPCAGLGLHLDDGDDVGGATSSCSLSATSAMMPKVASTAPHECVRAVQLRAHVESGLAWCVRHGQTTRLMRTTEAMPRSATNLLIKILRSYNPPDYKLWFSWGAPPHQTPPLEASPRGE